MAGNELISNIAPISASEDTTNKRSVNERQDLTLQVQELDKDVLLEEHKKIKMEQDNLRLKSRKLELKIHVLEQMINVSEQ